MYPIILTVFLTVTVVLLKGQLSLAQDYYYDDPHFLANRSVIVHLFEWKFNDVANECERFLGPKGYGGVQVSPVNENIIISNAEVRRPWWERYQPMSYRILTRSGNEDEFREMSKRCNRAGVRIYVDVVFNHMAAPNEEMFGTAGSKANGSLLDFPEVPYTKDDFHRPCTIDNYKDAHVIRNCQLGTLPDIDQSQSGVRGRIVNFLNHLIELGVAGFRIDAAKHMWPNDLQAIYNSLNNLSADFNFSNNSRPFIYQEVIDLGGEPISKTEYNGIGAVTEFQAGVQIGKIFRGAAPLSTLINWGPAMGLLPHRDALIFVDNHDNQRGHGAGGDMILTHKNPKPYRMATAFLLAHPYGIVRIMSSYYFNNSDQGPPSNEIDEILSPVISKQAAIDDDNDGREDDGEGNGTGSSGGEDYGECSEEWVCEHRWNSFANLVEFRRVAGDGILTNWQDNGASQIAFCRGDKTFIAFNADRNVDYDVMAFVCVEEGNYCDVISGGVKADGSGCTGKLVSVLANGTSRIKIAAEDEFGVIAIHAESKLR